MLGKQSEQQWREHMLDEERERQLGYDRRHLAAHRAVVQRLMAARGRYDRAKTASALAKVRAEMPARLEEIRKRVTAIDHWGNNSRVLADYAALEASLEGVYPDAKQAAQKGDAAALERARADFDQRVKTIASWLKQAAESEGDE